MVAVTSNPPVTVHFIVRVLRTWPKPAVGRSVATGFGSTVIDRLTGALVSLFRLQEMASFADRLREAKVIKKMRELMGGQSGIGWKCGTCGQQHRGLTTVFVAQAPDVWLHATTTEREAGELTGDM